MSNIAGIDLGTTFSVISHLNPMGRPDVVANKDGERIMPSATYFAPDGRILTGGEAIRRRQDDASRSIRWIKRHMCEEDHKTIIDGKEYTPAELSSLILRKMAQDTENKIGKVKDVVISVPANFGEVARKATMDAGHLAGLNVIGIVNEPTAAAFYYAIAHEIYGKVLVFDLGGGTFDVSIVNVAQNDIDIVTSSGDHNLGGYDFDMKLLDFFEKTYKEKTGESLYDTDEEKAELEEYAEETKRALSTNETVSYRLKGKAGTHRGEMTRADFEAIISSDISRIELLIEMALVESDNEPKDIEKVLLVGGSSRIPAVQGLLKRIFGYEPSQVGNMDECVSLGAALYAGLRLIQKGVEVDQGITTGLSDVQVGEICNHSYGTIYVKYDELTEAERRENAFIIPKNTKIPCSESNRFFTIKDGQEGIRTHVTQGESEDPDLVNIVAEGVLELPPGRPAGRPIQVTYTYDKNERMKCVFYDEDSGRKEVITLDTASGKSSVEILKDQHEKLSGFTVE